MTPTFSESVGFSDLFQHQITALRVSVMSAVSNAGNVTTSRHHFATSNALPAWIVGATGGKAVARVDGAEAVDEDGQVVQVASVNVKAKMPADMRWEHVAIGGCLGTR